MKMNIFIKIVLLINLFSMIIISECKSENKLMNALKVAISSRNNNTTNQNRNNINNGNKLFVQGINKKYLVDEVSEEDKIDPNAVPKKPYRDLNHDFEKHTLEEVTQKLYRELSPEHIDYNFD